MDVSPLSTRYPRAEVNNAMQTLTGVSYQTSEQQKDTTEARKLRDYNDTLDLIDYLSQRDPFSQDHAQHCIATGVLADEEVNVNKCKEVGDKMSRTTVSCLKRIVAACPELLHEQRNGGRPVIDLEKLVLITMWILSNPECLIDLTSQNQQKALK
ncbi:hypothetical protein P5673_025071 [Acropora cervicornis]|uniref:Uncharacterized protein n=1 Tax=Acropora cervicornis TaxID=6130 RepID=A0AAD9UXU3_ACRCE|nr:hypothetical protein P5673_025071 [Acropora cervicornis]